MKTVTPAQLKAMLHDGRELALLDVREGGVFSKQHLLFACCVPLSHMELMMGDLVPRFNTRIILMDEGPSDEPGPAEKAAERLSGFGYSDISILENGIEGWRAAGFELFSGVNVPSKAFGEFVESTYDTPRLTPEELTAKVAAGEKPVILDSRPIGEYSRMNIPTGICTPGAELVYRVHDMAPDPETLVVVNCAGRTRSIIGAQSLINAGIPNPVAALKGGTMGWVLAGFELERGQNRKAPPPSAEGLVKARACSDRVAKRFGVKKVDRDILDSWREDTDVRTLYILDVRLPEEYEAGHLNGARNAQGGQLVQATDKYLAVRNARVVLTDDTEVRAQMTASWLVQMGWTDVYVLDGGIGDAPLIRGRHEKNILGFEKGESLSPMELKALLDSGDPTAVVDLSTSLQYRDRHIPGAWWGVRSRLESCLTLIQAKDMLVLTSPDGLLAHLTFKEAKAACPHLTVRILDGGNRAWVKDGLPTAGGMEKAACETDDVWYKPYDSETLVEQRMRDYLDWEAELVRQIERDGDAEFRVYK